MINHVNYQTMTMYVNTINELVKFLISFFNHIKRSSQLTNLIGILPKRFDNWDQLSILINLVR